MTTEASLSSREITLPVMPVEQELEKVAAFNDVFEHWQGTPSTPGSEVMLPLAWQTHAAGYLRTGLAKQAAIQDGMLSPVIDKSRHLDNGILYYLATNPSNLQERSTARLVDAQAIEALPTFPLTGTGINQSGRDRLENALARGYRLREINALANSLDGHSRGSSEILRRIMIDTIATQGEQKQILFCSMVDKAYQGLLPMLSPANLEPIGDPVTLEENEYRRETTLIPIVIEPDKLVLNIFKASANEKDPRASRRYLESALFFAEPLPESHIPEQLQEIRAAIGRTALRSNTSKEK